MHRGGRAHRPAFATSQHRNIHPSKFTELYGSQVKPDTTRGQTLLERSSMHTSDARSSGERPIEDRVGGTSPSAGLSVTHVAVRAERFMMGWLLSLRLPAALVLAFD